MSANSFPLQISRSLRLQKRRFYKVYLPILIMVTLGKGGLFAQSYEVCHGCHLRFEGGGMMAFGFKTKVFTGSNFLPKIGIAAEITLDDTREGFLLGRGSIFRYHDKYYRVVAISRENPNGEDRGNMEFVQMSQLPRFARVVNGRKAH